MRNLIDKNIIIACSQPWQSPMVSKHYITLELAKLGNHITFISIHKVNRAFLKNRRVDVFKFHAIEPKNVRFRSWYIPPGYPRSNIFRLIAKKSLQRLFQLRYYPYIIISFDPQFYLLHEMFPKAIMIYYCADYLPRNKVMAATEERMLSVSDIVCASSQQLYKDLKANHPVVYYLPHGVNILAEHNDLQLKRQADRWFLDKEKKLIFGFVGYLSDNVDFDLIRSIADKNRNDLFVLAGPHAQHIVPKLERLPPNVVYPGPIPTIALKYWLPHFDVGIIPYVRTKYILRSNPTKILQYIASGLPVVTTEVGEVYANNEFVYQCTNAEEFEQNLRRAYENNSKTLVEKRLQYARENSWQERIERLDDIIEQFK